MGTFPYLYGYQSAGEGEVFMGFVGRGTPGANGYLMLARQVAEGNHLMENRVTPEALPRIYVNLEWWLFGMIARIPGMTLMLVFHLGRILTVPAFLLSVYYLASKCLQTTFERRLAISLVAFGSGLGCLLLVANNLFGLDLTPSLDLKGVAIPGYLVNKPHFIRAGIFAALKYAFLLQAMRSGKTRYAVFSGLAAMGHSAIRPYHISDYYAMCVLFPLLYNYWAGGWSWQRVRLGVLAGVTHLPAIAFFAWLAWTDALGMSGWARVPGYLIENMLWGGIPFTLCCAAFLFLPWRARLRELHDGTLLLGLWLLIAWGVCNLYPYWVAGHEAFFYPLFIAAGLLTAGMATSLLRAAPTLLARWPRLAGYAGRRGFSKTIAVCLVIAVAPSTVYTYTTFFTTLHRPEWGWTYYTSQGFIDACRWLEENSATNEVVLASHDASQFIPRLTDNKTVTGHDMLTAEYADKNAAVQRFYVTRGDHEFKQKMLQDYKVRYVLRGELERRIGNMDPSEFPWLERVYRSGNVEVYRVK